MADVVYLALLVLFFVMATAFVRLCDWLIGPPERGLDAVEESDAEPAAAVAA